MSNVLAHPLTSTQSALLHGKTVAVTKTHARLISSRRAYSSVFDSINDNGITRVIRATRADQPELTLLSPSGRTLVRPAVLAMNLAMHGGPNETNR